MRESFEFAIAAPGTPNSETASDLIPLSLPSLPLSPRWKMLLSDRTEDFLASLPRLPIFRSMTDAEDTVDEMEMLSVELFILEFSSPNRLLASFGSEPPLPVVVPKEPCLPIPACRLDADEAAKREGNTGDAPLGGVRGSFVE